MIWPYTAGYLLLGFMTLAWYNLSLKDWMRKQWVLSPYDSWDIIEYTIFFSLQLMYILLWPLCIIWNVVSYLGNKTT